MKKEVAIALRQSAEQCATTFSNPSREYNRNQETFEVDHIAPLSESIAAVTMKKNTGKKALVIFYFVKDTWRYFFPTDSHLLGLSRLQGIKERIEEENFKFNFDEESFQ